MSDELGRVLAQSVNNWLSNDAGLWGEVERLIQDTHAERIEYTDLTRARECVAADRLKAFVEDYCYDVEGLGKFPSGLVTDLFRSSFDRVDWYHLARLYCHDFPERRRCTFCDDLLPDDRDGDICQDCQTCRHCGTFTEDGALCDDCEKFESTKRDTAIERAIWACSEHGQPEPCVLCEVRALLTS